eukprot:15275902-Heterocapsa_arctica.AAC.1
MRLMKPSTSACRLVLEHCTNKLMQVMDAENFVDKGYRKIIGEEWQATAEQRRKVGGHRLY